MRVIEGKLYRLKDKEPIRNELKNKKVKIIKIRENWENDYYLRIEFIDSGLKMSCKEEYLKPIKNNIIKI